MRIAGLTRSLALLLRHVFSPWHGRPARALERSDPDAPGGGGVAWLRTHGRGARATGVCERRDLCVRAPRARVGNSCHESVALAPVRVWLFGLAPSILVFAS